MDLETLPDELIRSQTKIAKIDARRELASGYGATTSGQALVTRYHDRLTQGFRIALLDAHSGQRSEAELVVVLRGLSPELLALSSLQQLLHSIGRGDVLVQTLNYLGRSIAAECWSADLTEGRPVLAARIARAVKLKYSNVERRQAAMRGQIEKMVDSGKLKKTFKVGKVTKSFKARTWTPEALVTAGGWLWNVVSTALPEVFIREAVRFAKKTEASIRLSPTSLDIIDEVMAHTVRSNPILWPSAEPPKPWTGLLEGGSWDPRVSAPVLRSYKRDTQAAVKAAIKSGQMQPALDALNTLQAVPFRINTRVLEVLEQCDLQGIQVAGMVPQNLPRPEKPNSFEWDAMDKAHQGRWYARRSGVEKLNRSFIGERIQFAEDMKTAFHLLEMPRFYTPMNFDWRGRVYGLSHFNFQREDRVRALFLFADGAEIATEGIEWLKVHTANCADFGKISKRPLQERKQWCNDNTRLITNVASDPLAHTEWMAADKPFLFLAACFELAAALEQGPSFITRLPTSYDGSCSGLQHLTAMTRAEEGALVNLTPSETPQDVYQLIADDVFTTIARDLTHEPDEDKDPEEAAVASKDIRTMAQLFLDWDGDRRKAVKRNVMTYAYSSKRFGMAAQQQVDLMSPLSDEVLDGTLEEHPFEGYQHGPYDRYGNQQPSKAARYLAGHVYDAILERIKKPAEAMEFLQKIAKALAHEGKPVSWTTPCGIPWINRYHEPDVERISLFLNDGGVKSRARLSITTGDKKDIDKAKAANGVAPNFVHALDASHLLLVANAATAEGITGLATVHDSFGCLAPHATRFNQIIREQFALMYETHNVLAEILAQASADLSHANQYRLPVMPEFGNLQLKDIYDAPFAFA